MINIFLSASVPLPERHPRFYETADVLCIREAIKALIEVVLPVGQITYGSHPAITPLISFFAREGGFELSRVSAFLLERFQHTLPSEIFDFGKLNVVPDVSPDLNTSLTKMRIEMITSKNFDAAVIIGGMEGIFEEVKLFKHYNPKARIFPIASTGGAAAIVYTEGKYPEALADDLTYVSLFRRHLLKAANE